MNRATRQCKWTHWPIARLRVAERVLQELCLQVRLTLSRLGRNCLMILNAFRSFLCIFKQDSAFLALTGMRALYVYRPILYIIFIYHLYPDCRQSKILRYLMYSVIIDTCKLINLNRSNGLKKTVQMGHM